MDAMVVLKIWVSLGLKRMVSQQVTNIHMLVNNKNVKFQLVNTNHQDIKLYLQVTCTLLYLINQLLLLLMPVHGNIIRPVFLINAH